jgi:hypothetical protein
MPGGDVFPAFTERVALLRGVGKKILQPFEHVGRITRASCIGKCVQGSARGVVATDLFFKIC